MIIGLPSEFSLRKIYLLTMHGWYILRNPAPSYAPHYSNLQAHHGLAHAVLSCVLGTLDISLDVLLGQLRGSPLHSHLSREDLTTLAFVSSAKISVLSTPNYCLGCLSMCSSRLLAQGSW